MADSLTSAQTRLDYVRSQVEKARRRFGAPPEEVKLIAVSKTFDKEAVEPFLQAGQRLFGENRVQEAKEKWAHLKAAYPDVELHLIGPLQTNKAREAVALFDVIETVDRDKLASILASEMKRAGKRLDCFVQVNIGGEEQKAGIAVEETLGFVDRCRSEHGLHVVGLMCIPPDGEAPGPYFALLSQLAREARLDKLSMGMSGDFETAIAMGATHVRVGSALFGSRSNPA